MKNVGIIGWRGMVGSVLMNRFKQEGDFKQFNPILFSTSQAGETCSLIDKNEQILKNAFDISELKKMDFIVTCQGSSYTESVLSKLINDNWKGVWIDAASYLRTNDESTIVLDPINKESILEAKTLGKKLFVGGNCTVSLMLMALGGLFKENHVEWLTSMTYQAASGAGAKNMKELIKQMQFLSKNTEELVSDNSNISELDSLVTEKLSHDNFPKQMFGFPLAANLLPWIDTKVESGQSREEWKGMFEANKILNTSQQIPIDGTCVRVSSMRSHAQAFTIKLKSDIPISEIEDMINQHNNWVKIIPNEKEATLTELTPEKVSGTLNIPIGRVRKMTLGDKYLNAFTVGDQLLWGAAEPLRRALLLLL
ncbi:MAG: aspartate-semialdehyde dehydrogenase [Bdellovibrionales bacterium]|nr:aspartate-semialdehyde dehydrogenase [Bdellovibrionales bacterium]